MMNSTTSCNIDCLEMRVGFWVEGVILPVIAALGIIGQDTFFYKIYNIQTIHMIVDMPYAFIFSEN